MFSALLLMPQHRTAASGSTDSRSSRDVRYLKLCGAALGPGATSVQPEKLLRAMLLQAFYSVPSKRQLMERIGFDLLFRWFVGIEGVGLDEELQAKGTAE
jgi:transposase